MRTKYEILDLNSGIIHKVGKLKLDRLIFKKEVFYHHALNIYCYTAKKVF